MEPATQMTLSWEQCVDDCVDCHAVCLASVAHCLQKGEKHADAEHIRLLMDCAEVCQMSANFLLRGSELHPYICDVCAEVCSRCAKHCERLGTDPQMQACIEACQRCAESCEQMAATA